MPDDITPGPEPTDPTPPAGEIPPAPPAGESQPKTYDEAYVKKLRDEAASLRVKNRDYEKAEEERKAASLSEIEREKQARTKAEAELADARRALMVRDAATKHGLDPDVYEFLTGSDEAAIQAQAEKLAAKIKAAPKPNDLPGAGARNPANESGANGAAGLKSNLAAKGVKIPGLPRG